MKIPTVPFQTTSAPRGDFRWLTKVPGYEISTVDLRGTAKDDDFGNIFRGLRSALTQHPEAPFETCIFILDEHGARTVRSNVVKEYKTRAQAARGHDEIVNKCE